MDLKKRKEIRLKNYDYSESGAYFVTICTKNRQNLFGRCRSRGDLRSSKMSSKIPTIELSNIGKIIDTEINKIVSFYKNVQIDKYVIMPNHIHIIIILNCNGFQEDGRPQVAKIEDGRLQVAPTISRIVQQFKGSISKKVGYPIWQKLFYDRIIRNENEYLKIWKYIDENPLKSNEDYYYV